MSLFNLKPRIDALGETQLSMLEKIKLFDPRFANIKPSMLSDMLKGKYDYGMGPEVISLLNSIVTEMEESK